MHKVNELYNEGIEKRNIFPNDELIILENKISEFTNSIQNSWEEIVQEQYKQLMKIDESKRYNLKYDKKRANEIKAPSYSFGVNEIKKLKIVFEAKKFKVSFDNTYSFITMYDTISSILNKYYEDLDESKINKEEYNKLK